MSIRVDTAPLIAGSVVVGVPGLGVLGSLIPATGEHGPGYAYDDLIAGDETREIRGLITTWPSNGTLTAFEDTSFEYDGTSDTFAYQLYVDGVARGSVVTHTITIGAGAGVSGTITASITDATASLAGQIAVRGTITATAEDATASLSGAIGPVGVAGILSAQATDCTASLAGKITIRGALDAYAEDCSAALSGQIRIQGVLTATIDDCVATLRGVKTFIPSRLVMSAGRVGAPLRLASGQANVPLPMGSARN